jgi:carbamoylphosphate synthase large subunit
MNERIKELAKEAAREMNETGTYSEPKFQEKFAELIVRECKDVLLNMINNQQGDFDSLDQVLTEINERFGVEE